MADYKITRISNKPPNEWFDKAHNSTIYYINVVLEGHDKPVSVGKKSPTALSVGQVISGTIIEQDGPEDKWKAAPMGQGSFGGSNSSFGQSSNNASSTTSKREYVDHSEDIKAQWAIGQAVNLLKEGTTKTPSNQAIELWADTFFEMVERVKNHERPSEAPRTVVPTPMSNDDAEAISLYQSIAGSEPFSPQGIPDDF